MLAAAQAPLTGDHHQKLRLNSGHRKPLQPKNNNNTETPNSTNKPNGIKLKQEWIEILPLVGEDSNKENRHPIANVNANAATPTAKKIELPLADLSLAEELSAIRKKLDRLRLDREKTENVLKERDLVLDMQMRELVHRGEVQKMLEMEVDRLYRLKELKSYCLAISPIRSLREKEKDKKINEASSSSQEVRTLDVEESVDENELQSPASVSSKLDPV